MSYEFYEWFYARRNKRYGPVTPKDLKELADSGQLDPCDKIGCRDEWVTADKLDGLLDSFIPQATTAHILWAGQWMFFDLPVAIRFDGQAIGQGSFKKGFKFVVETDPGQHTLGVKFSIWGEKQYAIALPDLQSYAIELAYNSFPGTFSNECTVSPMPMEGDAVIQQWEREKQASICPYCGAEWAVEFLGEKYVKTDHRPQTIMQTEKHYYENPNFARPDPLSGFLDSRRYFESYTNKEAQVFVAYVTYYLFFKCCSCKKRWKKKDVRTYVP